MVKKKKKKGLIRNLVEIIFFPFYFLIRVILTLLDIMLDVICIPVKILQYFFGSGRDKKKYRDRAAAGVEFEHEICRILKKNGFREVRMTKTSGDFGTDILAKRNGLIFAIQCKYYTGSVGVDAVQQASSGCQYYEADLPVVVTNSYFTRNAVQLAEQTGVVLWNGEWVRKHKHRRIFRSDADLNYNPNRYRWLYILLLLVIIFSVIVLVVKNV
ncbi:MAG: restriction endonuclease [Muricoprocola sp.]